MKKTFMLLVAATAFMFMACNGNKNEAPKGENEDSTEVAAEPQEEKVDTLKGPVTVDVESFSVDVPEGWYVKSKGSNSCDLEPLVSPNIDGKSNFGWRIDIFAMSGEIFKAEDCIKEDKDVFENTKRMPDIKLGDVKYMYNFYDYEFGKHSVLAASLPKGGYVQVKVGGYAVEDKEISDILKTIKLK